MTISYGVRFSGATSEPIDIRYNHADHELRLFVTFMVNTFIRPSDAKQLRHRHIEVVQTKDTRYLRITTQTSKTVNSPIISMPQSVPIYDKLTRHQKAKGFDVAPEKRTP